MIENACDGILQATTCLQKHSIALFLANRLSSAITGEVLYVDCGYNIMGF
jgi:enoyl-[acyl-carrier-protein] reductase (NADH)